MSITHMAHHSRADPGPAPEETFRRRGRLFRVIFHNAYFWLFFFLYPAFAYVLFFQVQDRPFRVGSRSAVTPAFPLYQTEVSALISLAEVIIAGVYTPWCAIAAWRMIYLLLATRGARLPELSRLAHGGLPRLGGFGRQYRRLSYLLVVTTAASFFVKHLPKPLLAASIAWTPIAVQSQNSSTTISLPVAGESIEWDKFNIFEEEREKLVVKSAGTAFAGPSPMFEGTTAVMRRFLPATEHILVNSTITRLSVPFFMVDKLEWVSDPGESLSSTLLSAITDDGKGFLNISSAAGVMTKTVIGNTGILKTTPWTPSSIKFVSKPLNRYAFPESKAFEDERFIAVLVERVENPKDDKCPKTSRYFGDLPAVDLYPMHWYMRIGEKDELYAINCYAIAKASIRAGSFRCSNCSVVSSRTAEAILPSDGVLGQDISDPLVLPILDTLPEVMLNIAIMNGTGARFWNNLDAYTRGMMRLSYQATWNAMTDTFQGEASVSSEVFAPEYLITLRIDMRWFLPWVFVIGVGIFSGLVFVFVSVLYRHDVVSEVRDPVFAALVLDLGQVYRRLRTLYTSGKPGEEEEKITFKFADEGTDGGGGVGVRRLVVGDEGGR
ncbi:hypothetical protein OQA88_9177 [Cercophora sp. LCS_1]